MSFVYRSLMIYVMCWYQNHSSSLHEHFLFFSSIVRKKVLNPLVAKVWTEMMIYIFSVYEKTPKILSFKSFIKYGKMTCWIRVDVKTSSGHLHEICLVFWRSETETSQRSCSILARLAASENMLLLISQCWKSWNS